MAKDDGLISLEDLASYEAVWRSRFRPGGATIGYYPRLRRVQAVSVSFSY